MGDINIQQGTFSTSTGAYALSLDATRFPAGAPAPIVTATVQEEFGNVEVFITSIANQSNIKAVLWGHVHHESESKLKSIKMLSTPSTCYQFLESAEKPDTNKPGYRKINLFKSGKLETKVVRID